MTKLRWGILGVAKISERLLPASLVGARDGWADLDERTLAYRGEPRVFAVGAAAGMVLGPAARNIDGHRVAQIARVVGTDTGGFMGLPPTGKPFRLPLVFLYTLDELKKTEALTRYSLPRSK